MFTVDEVVQLNQGDDCAAAIAERAPAIECTDDTQGG
jgi:hypothetical protein